MPPDVLFFSITKLYSRIVLNKISPENLLLYRQVEKNLKKQCKIKADIIYLKTYLENTLHDAPVSIYIFYILF